MIWDELLTVFPYSNIDLYKNYCGKEKRIIGGRGGVVFVNTLAEALGYARQHLY